jgi:ABC-type antimicrobial peptide transport system permease subunit
MAPASPISTTTTLLRQSALVSRSDRFRGGLKLRSGFRFGCGCCGGVRDRSTSPQRVAVTLLGILGGLALLLATVGLYAVMSYTISQGTREFGLRMALGAGAWTLLRQVLSRGLALTGVGVLLGIVAALGTTQLLGNLLYRVSPRDPAAFGCALMVMAVASLAACFWPAWRALGRIRRGLCGIDLRYLMECRRRLRFSWPTGFGQIPHIIKGRPFWSRFWSVRSNQPPERSTLYG